MQGGASFQGLAGRILKANLLTTAAFAAIWLVIILYFSAQRDRAEHIRNAVDQMEIDLLETRRSEKDFFIQDLNNPAFYQAALTPANVSVAGTQLDRWERHMGALNSQIKVLVAEIDDLAGFDLQAVRQLPKLAEQYAVRFRKLVETRHTMGFKDWGTEGTWRKSIHDLETSLKAAGDAPLLARMLQMRRDEKDFIIRGETKYIDEVKKGLVELRALIKAVPAYVWMLEKTDQYEKNFDAYLVLKKQIGLTPQEGLQGEAFKAVDELDSLHNGILDRAVRMEESAIAQMRWGLGLGGLLGLLVAGGVGAGLGRSVARPISAMAATLQSSATELQAAANQQATGTKEQATSMQEISTTINELLASSRQIADSARRVAQIAEHAGTAARAGDDTVRRSQESIDGIRKQVDLIVTHMLDLGKKSQEIGGVLEIINELAEQTNILAINATIEAAGGGENGKRFGVVADEIRKLADRVGGSTKEIQTLVEQVRGAVNATVMATETGSKAVDAGAKQFGDVAASFKQIAGLVGTNSEAGREIELTTKQQATAVEQVNSGVMGVGQATREMEASTTQTFQTATQLATVSRELSKLVNSSSNGKA